jgi:hypothetical protein
MNENELSTEDRVKALVDAAWIGFEGLMEALPNIEFSGEDVINASLNVARRGVLLACTGTEELTPEAVDLNRKAVRRMLERLMLDTVDPTDSPNN